MTHLLARVAPEGDAVLIAYGNLTEKRLPMQPVGTEGGYQHVTVAQGVPEWFQAYWNMLEPAMRKAGFRMDTYPDTGETVIQWKPQWKPYV